MYARRQRCLVVYAESETDPNHPIFRKSRRQRPMMRLIYTHNTHIDLPSHPHESSSYFIDSTLVRPTLDKSTDTDTASETDPYHPECSKIEESTTHVSFDIHSQHPHRPCIRSPRKFFVFYRLNSCATHLRQIDRRRERDRPESPEFSKIEETTKSRRQ